MKGIDPVYEGAAGAGQLAAGFPRGAWLAELVYTEARHYLPTRKPGSFRRDRNASTVDFIIAVTQGTSR
ncbi:MAG: hypothetical protein P0Y56_13910 [Candidatus Andeanibacterium colombiense]|uniref:Uncharacterized protein n=1 Tax=Candidatus Andeanibacterium colombiense TaxID=3121345 RepID=A0AAJ5X7S5_9SPHN|nr:MAG: hypothetical protein P0Y56_13910 [Sphingomonadaceae bacterium]